ncbi:unnamed protein product [Cyclocybe aegerita]|uniref:peptidylprolyl isomerase n=1 Tax=Cyclocybe aegerita TaxID=1973307 RepID=A0A8S0WV13_CYCAE|nr:unnamed protein product [Cyclocybe aegerita]
MTRLATSVRSSFFSEIIVSHGNRVSLSASEGLISHCRRARSLSGHPLFHCSRIRAQRPSSIRPFEGYFIGVLVPRMGVTKETLQAGDGATKPATGNIVEISYVGYKLERSPYGQPQQVEFCNSNQQFGRTFRTEIGTGKVIKGWDEGIKGMSKGEIARLTITPDFAYGAMGYAPMIPPHTTLIYEITLINIETVG